METTTAMRPCNMCGESKPVSEFYPNRTSRAGLAIVCKPCYLRRSSAHRRRDVEGSLFHGAKSNAKRRGIPFSLTREDIVIPPVCPVLGLPLRKAEGRMDDNSPSIDRRNSSLGYTRENCSIISWRANRLKNNGTLEDLRALVAYLKAA